MRPILVPFIALVSVLAGVAAYAFAEAARDPVVKRTIVGLADWPKGTPPVTAVLISDIHIGNSRMNQARLGRIVAQINALQPDIVLMAGDFVFGQDPRSGAKYAPTLRIELSRLHARFGTVAVLGNHDLWTGQSAVRGALAGAGVTVLQNDAVVRGPLKISGFGDTFTGQTDVHATSAKAKPLKGASILLAHSPGLEWELPKGTAPLLAGHTHCGQIVLPFIGPIDKDAKLDFNCGVYHRAGRTIVVTGGLGTSVVPFRLGAPPDLWLLTFGPIRF